MAKKEVRKQKLSTKNISSRKKTKRARGVAVAKAVGNEVLENLTPIRSGLLLPRKVVMQIADEVGKAVSKRIAIRSKKTRKTNTKIDHPVFLDTSAIIDMRVFDLAKIGAMYGNFIVLESVLMELKNIADSHDSLKKERGRRAMDALEKFKKNSRD